MRFAGHTNHTVRRAVEVRARQFRVLAKTAICLMLGAAAVLVACTPAAPANPGSNAGSGASPTTPPGPLAAAPEGTVEPTLVPPASPVAPANVPTLVPLSATPASSSASTCVGKCGLYAPAQITCATNFITVSPGKLGAVSQSADVSYIAYLYRGEPDGTWSPAGQSDMKFASFDTNGPTGIGLRQYSFVLSVGTTGSYAVTMVTYYYADTTDKTVSGYIVDNNVVYTGTNARQAQSPNGVTYPLCGY